MEGVALNTRWMLGSGKKFLGRKVTSLNIVGGGAKSNIWCQIFADVLNVAIRRVADPIEVNARGAAFIAAEALGYMKFEDAARYAAIAREYTPLPGHRVLYDKTFKEFVQYHHQTKDLYREMNLQSEQQK